MDAELTVKIPDHVMIREVGGQSVLFDLETEQYFGLDEIGTEILRHFAAGATFAETVEHIVGDYDVTAQTVAVDITALLESLTERGLVSTAIDNR